MFVFLFALYILPTLRASKSEDLVIFDNFDYGEVDFGSKEKMIDYALLARDKKMDLPPAFTICSSIHRNIVSSAVFFFQLYQHDGKPWFSVEVRNQRDLNRFQEKVQIVYYKKLSNIEATSDPVPIVPNSWYHGCTALDTVTGHMLVVVNGHIIIDQVIEEFINTADIRPKSMEGRLSLFKTFYTGYWYNSRNRLSNLNVYGSALAVDDMINITAGERCPGEGDYLSWKESQWNVTGNINQESMVKEEGLCYRPVSNIVLFTDIFVEWEECMLFCEKFPNTRAPSVGTKKEFLDVMRAVERIVIDSSTGYWIPITDSKIEGQWVDYYTSYPVDINALATSSNGGIVKNCGIAVLAWGGWQDWECKVSRTNHLKCLCESQGQMFLTMRGLCPDSNIDKYFVPHNKENDGQTLFLGLFKTVIEYHEADNLWHLNVLGVNSMTVATSDATMHSFLLGKSKWTVTGDNVECNRGMPYTAVLKLSGCKETEFTCHDGQCIKMEERCDQIMHCRDKSDEDECSLLVLERGYNQEVAPFNYNKTNNKVDPVKVNVSASILNVIEISEVNNFIQLKGRVQKRKKKQGGAEPCHAHASLSK